MSLHLLVWLILMFGWCSTGTVLELGVAVYEVDNR